MLGLLLAWTTYVPKMYVVKMTYRQQYLTVCVFQQNSHTNVNSQVVIPVITIQRARVTCVLRDITVPMISETSNLNVRLANINQTLEKPRANHVMDMSTPIERRVAPYLFVKRIRVAPVCATNN